MVRSQSSIRDDACIAALARELNEAALVVATEAQKIAAGDISPGSLDYSRDMPEQMALLIEHLRQAARMLRSAHSVVGRA